ncbi:MAG: ATP-binding cassette domain-containing protein [Candidatus Sericytochromatia bacterium]
MRAEWVELHQLVYGYGRQRALNGVSLAVPAGQSLALVGPNGAGKSTLLKLLTGLLSPQQGYVRLGGQPVAERSARRQFAFSPQHLDLPAGLRVRDVLHYVLGLYPQATPAWTAQISARFGMDPLLDKKADRLSGGENKRVSLVLALAAATPLVILDEPASALDSQYQHALFETVRSLRGKHTLIFVSHNYQEIMRNADRLVRLEAGELVSDTLLRPEDAEVSLLRFAAPVCPPLPGVLQQRGVPPFWEVQVRDGDAAVRALIAQGVPFSQLEITRQGHLGAA